jgi:hypothetical protein
VRFARAHEAPPHVLIERPSPGVRLKHVQLSGVVAVVRKQTLEALQHRMRESFAPAIGNDGYAADMCPTGDRCALHHSRGGEATRHRPTSISSNQRDSARLLETAAH